jgi:hypothetical protein
MYCPTCGKPRTNLWAPCPECGAPAVRGGGSGWAWFFAGSTLALATMLGVLLWALAATGLSTDLLTRLGGGAPHATAGLVPTPSARAPSPSSAEPTPATATSARVGDLISSGPWKLVVTGSRSEANGEAGSRLFVGFTVKDDGGKAAALEIPSTAPPVPRARPASDVLPVQANELPRLQLNVLDRARRSFGGSFVGADGQPSGSYSLILAPGDAVALTYAFDVPASSAEPFTLELRFGSGAGGTRAEVQLDQKAAEPAQLTPSDVGKIAAKDEPTTVADLWRLTVTGLDVGQPSANGVRDVTVHLKAENLTDEAAVVAGPRGDGTGQDRDFYAVDAAGHLAYSSGDTMPTTRVPAKSSRAVDVKLTAGREFAATGPWRFSVIVDPRNDRYAVFRLA